MFSFNLPSITSLIVTLYLPFLTLQPYRSSSYTFTVFSPSQPVELSYSGFNFIPSLTCPCPFFPSRPFHYLSPSFPARLLVPPPPPPSSHSLSWVTNRRRGLEMGIRDKKVMDKLDGEIDEEDSGGWERCFFCFPTRRAALIRATGSLWGVTWNIIQTVLSSYRFYQPRQSWYTVSEALTFKSKHMHAWNGPRKYVNEIRVFLGTFSQRDLCFLSPLYWKLWLNTNLFSQLRIAAWLHSQAMSGLWDQESGVQVLGLSWFKSTKTKV